MVTALELSKPELVGGVERRRGQEVSAAEDGARSVQDIVRGLAIDERSSGQLVVGGELILRRQQRAELGLEDSVVVGGDLGGRVEHFVAAGAELPAVERGEVEAEGPKALAHRSID